MTLEGADHTVDDTGRGTVVRTRKPGGDGLLVTAEAALLALVAARTSVPVPRVIDVRLADESLELERLSGSSLAGVLDTDPSLVGTDRARAWAVEIVGFQRELAAVPRELVRDLLAVDEASPVELVEEVVELAAVVAPALDAATLAAARRFADTAPPPAAEHLVLCHADLGAEHVFVDADGAIVGVIDWSDAAITDPALDLGLVLRDLGADALQAAVRAHDVDDAPLVERAWFHARARCLEDLAFGLDAATHEAATYLRNAQRAAARLFTGS